MHSRTLRKDLTTDRSVAGIGPVRHEWAPLGFNLSAGTNFSELGRICLELALSGRLRPSLTRRGRLLSIRGGTASVSGPR